MRARPSLTSPLSKVRDLQLLLIRGRAGADAGTPSSGSCSSYHRPRAMERLPEMHTLRAHCCLRGQNKKWREEMPTMPRPGLTSLVAHSVGELARPRASSQKVRTRRMPACSLNHVTFSQFSNEVGPSASSSCGSTSLPSGFKGSISLPLPHQTLL